MGCLYASSMYQLTRRILMEYKNTFYDYDDHQGHKVFTPLIMLMILLEKKQRSGFI